MTEHDQRFKELLKQFLPEFLHLFFPEQASLFDLDRVEWEDKEVLANPPRGEVLLLDLVARLRLRAAAEPALALVHIEVESREAVTALRRRMFEYFVHLRRKYDCPVLPIALYLRVGLDGIGLDGYVEDFSGVPVVRFQFLYVGLPALEAERYVAGGSLLGVALSALMRTPGERKVWLRAEALRRILVECPENDARRWMLQECVERYVQLNDEEQQQFEQLFHTEPFREAEAKMITTFEKGVVKGLRQAARVLLERRFGPLSGAVLQRLDAWPTERLNELLLAVLDAPSLHALGLEDGNGQT